MKETFKTTALIIGTIIGAGFASGREIVEFYGRFGYSAFPLILLSGVIFFVLIFVLLSIGAHVSEAKIENANTIFFGKVAFIADCAIMFNYILVISAMLSGSDALLEGYTTLPIMSLIMLALTTIVVMAGMKGLKSVNSFLTPVLLILILITTLLTILTPSSLELDNYLPSLVNTPRQITNCLLYVGLNILLAGGLLVQVSLPKKTIIKTSFLSSVVITVMMLLILLACFVAGDGVMNSSLPILSMAASFNFHYIAMVIIWLGIFTTLLASTYILTSWLIPVVHYRIVAVLVVLLAGFALSLQGFSKIIAMLYPISGLIGIIYSLFACIYLVRVQAKKAAKRLPKLFPKGIKQKNKSREALLEVSKKTT